MTRFQDINITTWSCVKCISWAQEMVDSMVNDSRAFRVSSPLTLTRTLLWMVTLDRQLGMTYSVSVRDYLRQVDAEGETRPHCETHSGIQNSIKGKRMRAEHQRPSPLASSLWIWQTSHVGPHSHDFFTRMVCVPWTIRWNEPLLSCIASNQVSCHSNKERNHYRSRSIFLYAPLKFVSNDQNTYKF